MFLKTAFDFLLDLKFNNNRPWFQENKARYDEARTEYNDLIDLLIAEIKSFDPELDVSSHKDCVFRIYRDVRFSQNKEPYKTHFGAFIARGGRKSPYAGYYFHFEPDASMLGGGIYMPDAPVLKAIRTAIFEDPEAFKAIIHRPSFQAFFPKLYGESLKTAPKGFPKDFADLDLIRLKHYALSYPVGNELWEDADPLEKILEAFREQQVFNAYLNRIVEESTGA